MAISAVSPVSFRGNPEVNERKKGGGSKAAATFFIPGLGEFIDGRNAQGAFFFISRTCTGALLTKSIIDTMLGVTIDSMLAAKNDTMFGTTIHTMFGTKQLTKSRIGLIGLLSAATAVLTIANVVDAYNGGAKKEDKHIDRQA